MINITNRFDYKNVKIFKVVMMFALMSLIHGCVLTSPFWGQEFDHRTNLVPVQTWTIDKDNPVKVECAEAVPAGWHGADFQEVTLIQPEPTGMLDSNGDLVYSAGAEVVLPAECWNNRYGNEFYTVIKASQPGSESEKFLHFKENGLECLVKWIAKKNSWFGWSGKRCETVENILIRAAS